MVCHSQASAGHANAARMIELINIAMIKPHVFIYYV
jgi:hypothetical protein